LSAARCAEVSGLGLGGGPGLEQMLALFPPAESERRPDLHFLRGLAAFPRLDFDTLLAEMQAAAEGYREAGRSRDAALARAHVCLGLLHVDRIAEARAELAGLREQALDPAARAFVCYTSAWAAYADARTEQVAPMFEAMLDALEQVEQMQVWERCTFYTPFVGLPGMAALIERLARGALRLGGEAPSQLHAGVMHGRAWLALAAGRLAEAQQWLARADEDCRWLGRPRLVNTENQMAHGLMHALCGDPQASRAAARDNAQDMAHHSPLTNRLAHQYEGLAIEARACWLLQDEAGLRDADAALARVANPFEWRAAPRTRAFSQALLACSEARLHDAEALLAPLAAEVERFAFFPATQARWLLADVQQRQGRPDDAAATLRPWLQAAQRSGEIGGALLAGPQVLQRLAAQPWGARLAEGELALLRRLAALSGDARGGGAPLAEVLDRAPTAAAAGRSDDGPTERDGLVEGMAQRLTERELEVLARMAAGDSNKLIARAFDLSPHTVKRHVANILGKLDVQTRGQAAARWREQALQ
ncbi:MAG TPA: LuxR C-terminal-related transcriptional regulator, partial [Ideonella sp.]|nr:LuxR C-terminal-related transcriptional regulator [Ideonella sp.]